MASTIFSPSNWHCPNCQRQHTPNGSFSIVRGSCHHDVCTICIHQVANRQSLVKRLPTRKNRKAAEAVAAASAAASAGNGNGRGSGGNLVEISCPIGKCTWGKFLIEKRTMDPQSWGNVLDLSNDIESTSENMLMGNNEGCDLSRREIKSEEYCSLTRETSAETSLSSHGTGVIILKQEETNDRCEASVKIETATENVPSSLDKKYGTKIKMEQASQPKSMKRERPPDINDANLAHLVPPTPISNPIHLKPHFHPGEQVYSAWWNPKKDKKRTGEAAWYPGKIQSYNESKRGGTYGPIRYYRVKFDDGDVLDHLEDYWVFSKRDYELTCGKKRRGKRRGKWIGVKNKRDRASKDRWARDVGWYSVTLDGREQLFSRLTEAMTAYDIHVMRANSANGVQTNPSELNIPENYPSIYDGSTPPNHEPEEDSDDESRFSAVESDFEIISSPPMNKKRQIDNQSTVNFWSIVADQVDFSKGAFMSQPLFHLNPGIDGPPKKENRWFGKFLKGGIATIGMSRVPVHIANEVPHRSYDEIRDLLQKDNYKSKLGDRSECHAAMWLKDVTVGSFLLMRHEFPKCPFCPSKLKDNGKYIGPVYVIGVVTKKIMPESQEEKFIERYKMRELSYTFCLVDWRWMGKKSNLQESTKHYLNSVCKPTLHRMCQNPNKMYKSGATGESIRWDIWKNATIPISCAEFEDVFDYEESPSFE